MSLLHGFYRQRIEQFNTASAILRKRYDRYSLLRLTAFFGGAALCIWLWNVESVSALIATILFLAGFYRLMKWHQSIREAADFNERLARINAAELEALDHRFHHFPDGKKFLQTEHPNALDLDLFGEFSFFQYACRAATSIGQERLAQYLLAPASVPEILERQEAVAELRPKTDWRQPFFALGDDANDAPQHLQLLDEWLRDEDLVRKNKWLKAALWLSPLWFLCSLGMWIHTESTGIFLLLLVPIGWLLKQTKEPIDRIHLRTGYAAEALHTYARLLQHIENEEFISKKLTALQACLNTEGQPASRLIQQLAYIIRQLNVRQNFFAIFLNLAGLWDLHWVLRLEKWRAVLHVQLPHWFDALREFEALSSLANLWHNNPNWTMPEMQSADSRGQLAAVNLAHPLIPAGKRIGNDLTMPVRGHIKLITGSNMAGKSTFLRTVGLNVVLAQAGAPVCAERFSLPPMQVFSSMRTQDALQENASSFYAELKRLKFIIEAVGAARSGGMPVFFLLDEILKGTNSVDRHTGSAALIRQLIHLQGGGLISTHDLELQRLEGESGGSVENLCMEVDIRDGKLFFDYKLQKGVSKSFNATLLMREMGIEV